MQKHRTTSLGAYYLHVEMENEIMCKNDVSFIPRRYLPCRNKLCAKERKDFRLKPRYHPYPRHSLLKSLGV